MHIGFCNYPQINCSSMQSFNGKIDKTINTIKMTKDFRSARITVNEAVSVFRNFGYNVRAKSGSHMTVTAPDGFEFSFTLPHGSEKRFINPNDVKKLKCIINGDRQGLISAIKF